MSRKYFLDNDLSPKLASILTIMEEDVTCLAEHFPRDSKDEVWIPRVAEWGWVIITIDHKILTRPAERAALESSKATAFFLAKNFLSLKLMEQGEQILKLFPKIAAVAAKAPPGALYRVQQNGKVEKI